MTNEAVGLPLFDLAEGQARKDRGQEAAGWNPPKWREAIMDAIKELATQRQGFSANDVRLALHNKGLGDWQLHVHPNTMGACFSASAKLKVIECTDRMEKAETRLSNARRISIWRSLLFAPGSSF